jgi:hypothetical protein
MRYLFLLLFLAATQWANAQDGQQKVPNTEEIEALSLELAQTQLDAYNQRDIEAFLAPYSDSIRIYQYPAILIAEGKDAMRRMYTQMFERRPELQCQLMGRLVLGNKVVDREKVYLGNGRYMHAMAIYTIYDGKIQEVRFIQD